MKDESAGARSTRVRWIAGGSVVAVVLTIGLGWWLAGSFQSTAQQEANTKAPPAAPVFASVTKGVLAKQVAFTGQVGPSHETSVTLAAGANATISVVTGHPVDTGSAALSGDVLTEVNGRPVFAVLSPFAFYRDMGFGDHGPDVAQLQSVLIDKGYAVAADGVFGGETTAAVKSWYQGSGYTAAVRARSSTTSGSSAPSDKSGAGTNDSSSSASNPPSTVAVQQDAYVPLSEVVAVPSRTNQVLKGIDIGAHVATSGTADMVLGSADTVVSVAASASEIGDVVKGDKAKIAFAGGEVDATVGDIVQPADAGNGSDSGGSSGQAGTPQSGASQDNGPASTDKSTKSTFIVIPSSPLPATPRTGQARVTVTKKVLSTEALLVPVLAVTDRGADKSVLTKRRADGTLVEVPVRVLATLEGQVAVEPIESAALKVGDEVRVG